MTKKEKLIKALKELGCAVTGEETVKALQELKKKTIKEVEKSGNDPETETEEKEEKKSKDAKIYLWLKTRAYVSDSERINPGLYCLTKKEMFPRLEKAGAVVCEIFEGEIPSRSLVKIARKCGVDPDKYEEDEDLLDVLVTKGVQTF